MIRNTLEPTSENAAVLITPAGGVVFQWRSKPLEATHSVYSDVGNITLPNWIRLTRKGSQFTAHHPSDGIDWYIVKDEGSNQASSIEIPMDENVHIGLAITSGSPTLRTRARISHVTVTGSVKPDGPFVQSNDIGLLEASPTASR